MSLSNDFPELGPSYSVNLLNNVPLDPFISFTRASSGTYFDSTGTLKLALNNTPRFDYDPITRQPRGLLVESSRTNLCLQSENFATTWATANGTVTTNTSVSPDGTTTMDSFIENTALGFHWLQQTISGLTASNTYTASVFIKPLSNNRQFQLEITDAASGGSGYASTKIGTSGELISSSVAGSGFTHGGGNIVPVGNGIFRVFLTATISTITEVRIRLILADSGGNSNYTGDGVSGMYFWGCQFERGNFLTSYIPTTTGTVTRNVEEVSINNLAPWYNVNQGTIYSEWIRDTIIPLGHYPRSVDFVNTGTTDKVSINYPENQLTVTAQRVYPSGLSWPYTDIIVNSTVGVKGTIAYTQGSGRYCVNGTLGGSDYNIPTVPVLNRVTIGADKNFAEQTYINGCIKYIMYYPFRLTNSQLQQITL